MLKRKLNVLIGHRNARNFWLRLCYIERAFDSLVAADTIRSWPRWRKRRHMMTRVALAVLWMSVAAVAADTASTPVTFNKDVLPILQDNCQTCHRPNQIAPMSFLTYQEVRPWAQAMKTAVLTKQMPPWFADPKYGHFLNERKLSDT